MLFSGFSNHLLKDLSDRILDCILNYFLNMSKVWPARSVYLSFILAGVIAALYLNTASALAQTTPVLKPAAAVKNTQTNSNPSWASLTPQQKTALSPLALEWDKMGELRKKKWLGIAEKYSAMKPEEQTRMHERMSAWVKLTPEQRMDARENFARSTQIDQEQKSVRWQQYQQLTEEQKKQLAIEADRKKSITNLPSQAQRSVKPLAPIKIGPATPPKSTLVLPPPAIKTAPASSAAANVPPVTLPTTPSATTTPANNAPGTPAVEKVEK